MLTDLLLVGAGLIEETVNLDKLKNHAGLLLGKWQTETDSDNRWPTRLLNDETALQHLWKWLIIRLIN